MKPLSNNQKKVLRAFQRTGTLTMQEMRKTSPHWHQAARALRYRGLIEWEKLGDGYVITREGGATIAHLEAEEEFAVMMAELNPPNLHTP